MTSQPMWHNARKILCVRLDNLGDVLLTSPALRALKAFNPGAELALLTSHMGAGIARLIPEIDDVITFDVPWVKIDGAAGADAIFDLVARLRAAPFDAAILFTVFSQNPLPAALVCYLAGIPLRLGYSRENPYHLLTDWVPDPEPLAGIRHEVLRQLDLVRTIGAETPGTRLSLNVPVVDRAQALDKLAQAGVDPAGRWLVLHPGVSEIKRQYPPDAYAAAARELARQGYTIVLTGVESEHGLAAQIAQAVGKRALNLAGALSLGELIGLISAAPLLIANNTGPIHIAAAVGTPVVVLYAHTNPQHTPWQVPHRVLYFDVPEHLRSRNVLLDYTYRQTVAQPVHDAQPADIVAAVHDLLAETGRERAPLAADTRSERRLT